MRSFTPLHRVDVRLQHGALQRRVNIAPLGPPKPDDRDPSRRFEAAAFRASTTVPGVVECRPGAVDEGALSALPEIISSPGIYSHTWLRGRANERILAALHRCLAVLPRPL